MEYGVDLLAQHFHQVLVIGAFWNLEQIRLRADNLKEKRIWLWRTRYQRECWREEGGVMLLWQSVTTDFPADAVFMQECPRNIRMLDICRQHARAVSVVWLPPTWRLHEEAIEYRYRGRAEWLAQSARDDLVRVRQLLDKTKRLTPKNLRLCVPELSLSSSAPESPAAAAPPSDTSPAAP